MLTRRSLQAAPDAGWASAALAAAFLGLVAPASAAAGDRRVTFVNDTAVAVIEIVGWYGGRAGPTEDILGADVLAPGQSITRDLDTGDGSCLFDLRATFADAKVVSRRRFNACLEGTWRIQGR